MAVLKVSKHKPFQYPAQKLKKVNGKTLIELDTRIFFGQRKGYTVEQIIEQDPEYLLVLQNQSKFFAVDDEVLNRARKNVNWESFLAK